MLLLRRLTPQLSQFPVRLYAKKAAAAANMNLNKDIKQVHQETLRHINQCACIKIRSNIFVKVHSCDVHEFPDANVLIAELHGGPEKNATATMKIQVSEDEKQVDIELAKVADKSNFHCELHVPIRADLHIDSKDSVSVANMYGKVVSVQAENNINLKEIRVEEISLGSSNGDITCSGLLLGRNTIIEAKARGNISLDKVQGDRLNCKSSEGNISTKSCYVEVSKFETDSGNMTLKNVHKKTECFVHKKGDLNMTGVHGNIYVKSNGGNMTLQLSELAGENIIIADNSDLSEINISDKIEEGSYIEITASSIELDSSLSHLSDCISENNRGFRMSLERDNHNKLILSTRGGVKLGKLSWAETMRASLELPDN